MSTSESSISSSSDEQCEHSDNLELTGKILKKYNIINEIGRGADAIVWMGLNIEDGKYYAIKVNEQSEYKKGMEEVKFLKSLPKNYIEFNHIKDYFIEENYVCIVFELQTGNLDTLLRKSNLEDGLEIGLVKKIMLQLFTALKYMHKTMKIYHADIKTDNILLKGLNNYDLKIINQYNKLDFFETYKNEKKKFWLNKGKSLDTINKIKSEDKLNIRKLVHKNLCNNLIFPDKSEKYIIDKEYTDKCNITLSDFGTICKENEYFNSEFGTRYYRAPEIILMGSTSYGVDIWACGCVLYELLTGRILFDPSKDSKHSRDEYHLQAIGEICGKFPIDFLKKTKYWKNFFNKKGELHNLNVENVDISYLLEKYNVPDNCSITDLLKGMLHININKRFTIDMCLDHPFLK